MSDEDILKELADCSPGELIQGRVTLLRQRQRLRELFGHMASQFCNKTSPGFREYQSLCRLTDLLAVALSRRHGCASTGAVQARETASQNPSEPSDVGKPRRALVDAYIEDVLRATGKRI